MAVDRICDFETLNSHGHLEGNAVNPRKPVVEVMDDTVASVLREKTGMIKLNDDKLDYVYIKAWAMRLGINEKWLLILEHLGIGPA